MMGFEDMLREEAPSSVRACQNAGIKVKMITGDHSLTAMAVAQSVGIVENPNSDHVLEVLFFFSILLFLPSTSFFNHREIKLTLWKRMC